MKDKNQTRHVVAKYWNRTTTAPCFTNLLTVLHIGHRVIQNTYLILEVNKQKCLVRDFWLEDRDVVYADFALLVE